MSFNPQNPNGAATSANSAPVVVATDQAAFPTQIADGVTPATKATVAQFHNQDNQALAATANGLLGGGVAQLLNGVGNLDRQRETSADNISHVGVATGTQQLLSPISTTLNGAVIAGATTAVLTATKFTNRGANAWVGVGSALVLEPGTTNQETVVVTVINYSTNAITIAGLGTGGANTGFKFAHANAVTITSGALNQARDATVPDGSNGAGFQAGATFLFNSSLNAGAGGWESERSFSGELAGATGTGAAIAAEYEDTAGGPVLASGVASGLRLTPAQSLQGKGRQTSSITSTTAGNTSIVFPSAAATNLTLPGWPIYLSGSGTTEVVFTASSWVPGSSATVPLVSPVVNTAQTSAAYDSYAPNGPGLSGFLPTGVGIEEEALYNPVDGLYYVERAATADGMAPQNIVAESAVEWNGSSFDRARTPGVWKTIAAVAITAGTPVAVWTPAGGKKFRVMGFALSTTVAGSIILKDTTSVEWIRTPLLAASTPFQSPPNMDNGYLSSAVNNALFLDLTVTGNVSGFIFGTEE